MKALHMRDTKLIKISQDKPNCKFVVKKMSRGSWRWINVGSHGIKRTQIFTFKNNNLLPITVKLRTILLYSFFKQERDGNSFSGMYAMYHSKQNFCFPGPYSTLKCPLSRSLLLNSTKLCMLLLASRVQDILQPLQIYHSKPFALVLRHTGYWPKK